jgi:hypothetical protein
MMQVTFRPNQRFLVVMKAIKLLPGAILGTAFLCALMRTSLAESEVLDL